MASKPSEVASWNTGGSNNVEPSSGKKITGWVNGEVVPSSWLNWFMKLTGEWTAYLDDLTNQALTWANAQTVNGQSGAANPALVTSETPATVTVNDRYKLLWQIKVTSTVYARLYSSGFKRFYLTFNASLVDNTTQITSDDTGYGVVAYLSGDGYGYGVKTFTAGSASQNVTSLIREALIRDGKLVVTGTGGTPSAGNFSTSGVGGYGQIAAGASSVTITANGVSSSDIVWAMVSQTSEDATLIRLRAVPSSGSLTVYGNANATANTKFCWLVVGTNGGSTGSAGP